MSVDWDDDTLPVDLASGTLDWPDDTAPPLAGSTVSLARGNLWASRGAVQTIGSGVVTAISFTSFTSSPGGTQPFVNPVAGFTAVTFANYSDALFTFVVDFPAGAYDRYVELTVANPFDANQTVSPRVRSGATPDGDRLTLTAFVSGSAGPPATTVTFNVFQASGVNKNVSPMLLAVGIPYVAP